MDKGYSHEIKRQAVVIIHGMGEQRPMATLRSFVTGITDWIKHFDAKNNPQPRYWSRPDGVSELYETRRITMEKYDHNPKTDFYEFYYAHHMRKTSYDHLVPWVWKLLTTNPTTIPPRLKRLWFIVWGIIILLLLVCTLIYLNKNSIFIFLSEHWGKTIGVAVLAGLALRIITWIVKVPFSKMILNTAGDAARYFNPMPSNIDERSTIRREGIAFLKKLHNITDKPYDKIILVGHSLGSVVAYDMIRLLWHEYHEQFSNPSQPNHDIFRQMDSACAGDGNIKNIEQFRQLQHDCWKQYRKNGNPWLITDFITCGAAIAHADFYLLNNIPFSQLVSQKEFPTSPPMLEGKDTSVLFGDKTIETISNNGDVKKTTLHCLNHAAPFAVTRWVNIYFTSDFIGSDAKRIFRTGIKDVAVPRRGVLLVPGGHTNYWDSKEGNLALKHIADAIGFRQNGNMPNGT